MLPTTDAANDQSLTAKNKCQVELNERDDFIPFALRADLSVSVVGRKALVRPALRAIAG